MILDKTFLKHLITTPSPSGHEDNAINVFNTFMLQFGVHEFTDAIKNSCFSIGEGTKSIMLSGHIDEISLKVQYIDDNGFIYFISNGGVDPKTLLGRSVTILTRKSDIKIHGVIGKKPIHIERKNDEKDKVTPISSMKIDCGFETKEEALEYVQVGDAVIVDMLPIELGCNRFTGRGLDDKVGIYVVGEVFRRLSQNPPRNLKVYGVACTQEEVGATGAFLASKKINPTYSIDCDVTFATDDETVDKKEWGDIRLGKGGALAYGPDSNIEFTSLIQDICEGNKIPFQSFSLGSGCTDTLDIKKGATNAKTALISVPNRNMHTPVEIIDWRDIQSIIDMTVATIYYLDSKENNI